jgi:hypothetical protein
MRASEGGPDELGMRARDAIARVLGTRRDDPGRDNPGGDSPPRENVTDTNLQQNCRC